MILASLVVIGLAQGPVGGTNLKDGDLVDFAPGDEAFIVKEEKGTYASLRAFRALLEARAPDYAYQVRGVYEKPWFWSDQELPPRQDGETQAIYQDVSEVFVSRSGTQDMDAELWKKSYVHEEVRFGAIKGSVGSPVMKVNVQRCEDSGSWKRGDDPRSCPWWLPGDTSDRDIERVTRYLYLQLPHQSTREIHRRLRLLNTDYYDRSSLVDNIAPVLGPLYAQFCSMDDGELKSFLANSDNRTKIMKYVSSLYPGGKIKGDLDLFPRAGEVAIPGRTDEFAYMVQLKWSPMINRAWNIVNDMGMALGKAITGRKHYSDQSYPHFKTMGRGEVLSMCREMSDPLFLGIIEGEDEEEYLLKATAREVAVLKVSPPKSDAPVAEAKGKAVSEGLVGQSTRVRGKAR